jgi:membrane protease YdiL (CAAX protease family)
MAADRTWRRVALVEVAAMMAILLSFIWGWQGTFAGSSWLLVVLYFGVGVVSHLWRHESARQLGLRIDNVPRAVRNVTAVIVPAVAITLAIGFAIGSLHFYSWSHTVQGAPWMIVWGTSQQYGLLCFFYRRFLEILQGSWAATAAASLTFATFHVPNGFLVVVTLAAGVAACTLYRREPNLLVLGAAHALLSFVLLCSLPFSVTHGLHVGPGYLVLQ